MHEGVQLEFAHRGSSAVDEDGSDSGAAAEDGSSSGTASWRSGLDVLSGGQRTMVSLAFVVAVRGCRGQELDVQTGPFAAVCLLCRLCLARMICPTRPHCMATRTGS